MSASPSPASPPACASGRDELGRDREGEASALSPRRHLAPPGPWARRSAAVLALVAGLLLLDPLPAGADPSQPAPGGLAPAAPVPGLPAGSPSVQGALPTGSPADGQSLAADQALALKLSAEIAAQTTALDRLQETYTADAAADKVARGRVDQAYSDLQQAEARVRQSRDEARRVAVSLFVDGQPDTGLAGLLGGDLSTIGARSTYARVASAHVSAALDRVRNDERDRNQVVVGLQSEEQRAQDSLTRSGQDVQDAAQLQSELSSEMTQVQGTVATLVAGYQQQGEAAVRAAFLAKAASVPGSAQAPPLNPGAGTALGFARAQLGKPYLWGGTGPDAWDCSGLTQAAWSAAGVPLPRVASDQQAATYPISFSQLQPGDLVFFENPASHVGIYVGDELMIDAPHTGAVVRYDSIWWADLAGFGRVVG